MGQVSSQVADMYQKFNEGLDNAWESGDLRDSGQAVLLFLKSGHPKPDIAVELKEQGEIQSGTAQSGQAGSSKDTLESLGGGGQAKVVGGMSPGARGQDRI